MYQKLSITQPFRFEGHRYAITVSDEPGKKCKAYIWLGTVADDLLARVTGERYHRDPNTGERRIDDIYRDMVLKSLGWTVLRFWVYELREDFDGCIERIRTTYANGV